MEFSQDTLEHPRESLSRPLGRDAYVEDPNLPLSVETSHAGFLQPLEDPTLSGWHVRNVLLLTKSTVYRAHKTTLAVLTLGKYFLHCF